MTKIVSYRGYVPATNFLENIVHYVYHMYPPGLVTARTLVGPSCPTRRGGP